MRYLLNISNLYRPVVLSATLGMALGGLTASRSTADAPTEAVVECPIPIRQMGQGDRCIATLHTLAQNQVACVPAYYHSGFGIYHVPGQNSPWSPDPRIEDRSSYSSAGISSSTVVLPCVTSDPRIVAECNRLESMRAKYEADAVRNCENNASYVSHQCGAGRTLEQLSACVIVSTTCDVVVAPNWLK